MRAITVRQQPRRIQRKRTRGWRMPEGAVYVGRPSRWGNPFSVHRGNVIGPRWFDVKGWPLTRGVRNVDDEQIAVYSTHAPAGLAVGAVASEFTPARVDGRVVCATAAERDLWAQLADEVDAYLAAKHDDQPMLGEA